MSIPLVRIDSRFSREPLNAMKRNLSDLGLPFQ